MKVEVRYATEFGSSARVIDVTEIPRFAKRFKLLSVKSLKEAGDAIEVKYTSGEKINHDIDWTKYILWTVICVAFGAIIGMFITKLIYGV